MLKEVIVASTRILGVSWGSLGTSAITPVTPPTPPPSAMWGDIHLTSPPQAENPSTGEKGSCRFVFGSDFAFAKHLLPDFLKGGKQETAFIECDSPPGCRDCYEMKNYYSCWLPKK